MRLITSDRELIELFLQSFESAETRVTYKRRLAQYELFLEHEGISIRNSTESAVQKYLDKRSKGVKRSSINLQIAALKSLYNFAVANGYLNSSILSKFKISKGQEFKSKSQWVSDKDVIMLLRSIDKDKLKGTRQHALICLTYYCFVKISEALNVRHCDIIKTGRESFVRILANSKARVIPMPSEAANSLQNYIDILSSSLTSESEIFIRTEGKGSIFVADKPFTRAQAGAQLKFYRHIAALPENLTFENIRQAGLRRYVRTGGSLSEARKLYGCKIDRYDRRHYWLRYLRAFR